MRFVQWCDWGRANDRKLQGIDFEGHKQYTDVKQTEPTQEPDDEGVADGEADDVEVEGEQAEEDETSHEKPEEENKEEEVK